jgi:hypothetical protein
MRLFTTRYASRACLVAFSVRHHNEESPSLPFLSDTTVVTFVSKPCRYERTETGTYGINRIGEPLNIAGNNGETVVMASTG